MAALYATPGREVNRIMSPRINLQAIREFLYGMTGLEFAEHALEMRGSLESLFMLGTVGDMIGVPILPPYYSLRLLPYIVPQISTWKRRLLREKDVSDAMF
jgi:hypothetical protein